MKCVNTKYILQANDHATAHFQATGGSMELEMEQISPVSVKLQHSQSRDVHIYVYMHVYGWAKNGQTNDNLFYSPLNFLQKWVVQYEDLIYPKL